MAKFPRVAALALFRVHIENGLSVATGVGLTGLLAGGTLGFNAAVAAASGAVAISVSDQPDPLRQKPWVLGWALLIGLVFSALAVFTPFWLAPYSFIAVVVATGIWTGVISAYGKRALSLSMTGVLTLVYAMGHHFTTLADALFYLDFFMAGALVYALYAAIFAFLFDDRARRLALAEAMRGFATYLRAQAALYNPDMEGPTAFRGLIDAHATLVERLQIARDTIYSRRTYRVQRKRIDSLIALLDAFETMLASDADFALLRRSERRDLKWRFNQFILTMADDVEALTLALRERKTHVALRPTKSEDAALIDAVLEANENAPENQAMDHAWFVTANKLKLADEGISVLAFRLDGDTPPSDMAREFNLTLFQQRTPQGLGVLLGQLDLSSPAMRYGIRLALAMGAGLGITLIFPHFAHANWIILTIALIMRANYSVTSKRRWDRVTGTLIGCAVAVGLILASPDWLLMAAMVAGIGLAHAYAGVKYRITAIGASISSLVLLHFSAPLVHPQFFERIADTLIGAGLSYVFAFLLPNWEHSELPRLVQGLLKADEGFAEAALRPFHQQEPYRLARKRILDAVAGLAGAIRRLADEPNASKRTLAALNELLSANYALASDLASMPILMKLRGPELDTPRAKTEIGETRTHVMQLLSGGENIAPRDIASGPGDNFAMTVLFRRLNHIAESAGKVARLAARPAIREEAPHG
ncbi:MAG TPA: FUSC family membrane protein [Rhizomicrobium sp.]|jgi:uncharacterized membrane protein YccC|nr:FUSC family membrane protein [Rhizomicrobium sp.]